jgi:phage baseplate assembly protein W
MATFYGYNPPFVGGPQNILSRQEDVRLIQNDILQLLLTIPGERAMRPDFGVNLRNAVFEQNDAVTASNLESEIREQILRYDERVNIMTVTITRDDARHGMTVMVQLQLKQDPTKYITIEQFLSAENQ